MGRKGTGGGRGRRGGQGGERGTGEKMGWDGAHRGRRAKRRKGVAVGAVCGRGRSNRPPLVPLAAAKAKTLEHIEHRNTSDRHTDLPITAGILRSCLQQPGSSATGGAAAAARTSRRCARPTTSGALPCRCRAWTAASEGPRVTPRAAPSRCSRCCAMHLRGTTGASCMTPSASSCCSMRSSPLCTSSRGRLRTVALAAAGPLS